MLKRKVIPALLTKWTAERTVKTNRRRIIKKMAGMIPEFQAKELNWEMEHNSYFPWKCRLLRNWNSFLPLNVVTFNKSVEKTKCHWIPFILRFRYPASLISDYRIAGDRERPLWSARRTIDFTCHRRKERRFLCTRLMNHCSLWTDVSK